MSEPPTDFPGDNPEMQAYLQTFLDETEEQLEDLVETMLSLERDTSQTQEINEAFRLIHSIKGSAGMLGLDNITVLTHHLENRFERFRSGQSELDEGTMNLVLKCIDFLRHCLDQLRQKATPRQPCRSPSRTQGRSKQRRPDSASAKRNLPSRRNTAVQAESAADSGVKPPAVANEPTPPPQATMSSARRSVHSW